ncbi:MAG: GNAT family N-acetyltransferase [Proteobacteria bacterium]|nr:GNAT family N-acetyltransferase [Pseudomonadota bacterium]
MTRGWCRRSAFTQWSSSSASSERRRDVLRRGGRGDAATLEPRSDAAKIRAFFVDPGAGRSGIGSALLQHCGGEARRRGFQRAEMMATLPGVRLYAARGSVPGERVRYPLAQSLPIEFRADAQEPGYCARVK